MKKKITQAATLYLYLARRDKSGVRLISTFTGQQQAPVRVSDLKVLQLPANLYTQVAKIIADDRMMWEPWIESAPTYDALKTSLKRRGYSGLPVSGQPELFGGLFSNPQRAVQSNLPKVQTMVRRKD